VLITTRSRICFFCAKKFPMISRNGRWCRCWRCHPLKSLMQTPGKSGAYVGTAPDHKLSIRELPSTGNATDTRFSFRRSVNRSLDTYPIGG
jgi:hypothetical protein